MENFCAKSEKLIFDHLVNWFSGWDEEESASVAKYSTDIFKLLYLDLVTKTATRRHFINDGNSHGSAYITVQ